MTKFRAVLLAGAVALVPIALSATTEAQPASPGEVLYDASGQPVAVVRWLKPRWQGQWAPAAAFAPVGGRDAFWASFENVFAEQEALLARMMNEMRMISPPSSLTPGSGPTIEAGLPSGVEGRAMMREVISVANSRGVCTQTITYAKPAKSGAPQMIVQTSGDACGSIGLSRPTPAAQPAPLRGGPPQMPAGPVQPGSRIIKVDYRHPLAG